jgi:hypothetical protein
MTALLQTLSPSHLQSVPPWEIGKQDGKSCMSLRLKAATSTMLQAVNIATTTTDLYSWVARVQTCPNMCAEESICMRCVPNIERHAVNIYTFKHVNALHWIAYQIQCSIFCGVKCTGSSLRCRGSLPTQGPVCFRFSLALHTFSFNWIMV